MGYYNYRQHQPSKTALHHEWLTVQIKRIFDQHKGRYGSPRIALQLYDEGIETNKRVVAMLMQRAGLVGVYGRQRRKKQHLRIKENVLHENLLNRDFQCLQPNAIFVSDITYVRCSDGMLYLTLYLDLATRFPKEYAITENMKKTCVVEPLNRLISAGYAQAGTIIHSDQGSQYRSFAMASLCETHGLRQSMSRPGRPIDNAVAEAFFKTLKMEVVYPNRHLTKAKMGVILCNYLDRYYPEERIHTSLGMSPKQYEQRLLNKDVTYLDV